MQEQLNSFHMFTWKVVYYYCLKSCRKWFGINNHDGPFSTLLSIGHMTGRSVIWPMCNIPTLLRKGNKQVIFWCGWLFLALLKLIKLHTCWWGFPNRYGWEESPLTAKNLCYNALKTSFLSVVVAPVPFLF